MLYEKAPAKINLTLDILGKRPDGYHEVEMVMTTVDLADRIGFKRTNDDKITIFSNEPFIPTDYRNLAYQAAALLKKRYQVTEGVELTIEKHVPVAAGLAGGSSDAAATLRGLNRLWELQLTLDQLAELATEIGSDVAFCVYGGTALATGRGEKIQQLPSPPACWVVLAKPAISISTATIYRNVQLSSIKHPDTAAIIRAIEVGQYEEMCKHLGNALEAVTLPMHSEISFLKNQMERFGADAVLMSGSGPTVYGLVQQESRVSRICNGLKGFCREVYAVRLLGERSSLD